MANLPITVCCFLGDPINQLLPLTVRNGDGGEMVHVHRDHPLAR